LLPEGYEIVDSSLDDISAALHPTFTKLDIQELDGVPTSTTFSRRYLPRIYWNFNDVGENGTGCTNAMVQALAHVGSPRDFFLQQRHDDLYVPTSRKAE
jgi:U4/U6.U5 tri-snRNP-associated protein 2